MNAVYGDKSALSPGGVRIGTAALTSRGFVEKDFELVANFLKRATDIALDVQKTSEKFADFKLAAPNHPQVKALREEVEAFAEKFFMPGRDAQ